MSQPALPTEAPSGKYRRIARLGEGGMANVWLAATQGPGGFSKLLVLKELKPDLVADEEFVTMFLDEARLAARLSHQNVVQTFEVGGEGGVPFLVMEWLDGQALHLILGRLKRPNVPLRLQVLILAKVCAGLHYAHEAADFDGSPFSIVHRDVSPQNVFVNYDGTVKVVDFGIAKASNVMSQTRAGLVKGKIGYMAPEQAIGSVVDRRADVFAVGVMLWEALTGRRLTAGVEKDSILRDRIEGKRELVREIAPDAPALLADAADRAMERQPVDRFSTAADLGAVLEAWLHENPVHERELAEFVSKAFADERRRIREIIDETLQRMRGEASSGPVSVRSSQLPLLSDIVPISISSSSVSLPIPSETALTQTSSQPSILAAPPARAATPLIALISVLALSLAVVVGMLVRPKLTGVGTGEPIDAAVAPSAAPPAASGAPAGAEQAGLKVEIRITAAQSDVEATLGDARISLPFRASYPKSGEPLRLRVSAAGFLSEERLIVPDRDLALEIALKPAAVGAPGVFARPTGKPTKPGEAPTTLEKKSKPTGPQRPIEESVY